MNIYGTIKFEFNRHISKSIMAQDDFNTGVLAIFIWIDTVLLIIGSGILAWN